MKDLLNNYLGSYITVSGDDLHVGELHVVTDSYFCIIGYEGHHHYYPFAAILEIDIGEKVHIKMMGAGIRETVNSIPSHFPDY